MLGKLRDRLTYANVVATVCLFVVLGGGAYAASQLPENSVGNRQLRKDAVTSPKVKNLSLLRKDFKRGQLPNRVVSTSAQNSPSSTIPLSGTRQPVLGTTITTRTKSRFIATATIGVHITTGGAAECVIELGRAGSFTQISRGSYFAVANGDVPVPVTGVAPARPAGTYTVRVSCRSGPPSAGYVYGNLGVIAVGS